MILNEQIVLSSWDQCYDLSYLQKGLILSSLLTPENDASGVSEWSLEKRDIALFNLRKILFGGKFTNVCSCPKCHEKLEWDVEYENLQVPQFDTIPDNVRLSVDNGEGSIAFRLPSASDIQTIDERQIIKKCVLPEGLNFEEIEDIPESIHQLILKRYDEHCRFSNIEFQLQCTNCQAEWQILFDILSYVWKEIDLWAQKFLNHVSILAQAFGWSEDEIIKLSKHRRNYYLQLLSSK